MTSIIGGHDTGLLDSSLYLLGRNDRTGAGEAGHGEDLYVNISNGNLVIRHVDGYLPSQGEDFSLVRTYNSRGHLDGELDRDWSIAPPISLEHIDSHYIRIKNADSSQFDFYRDHGEEAWVSHDGAGAYEEIVHDSYHYDALTLVNGQYRTVRTFVHHGFVLTRADQSKLYFDGNGTLLQSRDTNGNVAQYEYHSNRLTRVLDDKGHAISYVYDHGHLVRVEDKDGGVLVSYAYYHDRLSQVTDRAGHVTRYTYNHDGSLASISLPADGQTAARVLHFEYAGSSHMVRSVFDAEGNETRFSYDFDDHDWPDHGGTTTLVNALGINRSESNSAEYVQWRIDNGYYATYDARSYNDGLFLDSRGRYRFDRTRWQAYVQQVDQIQQRHATAYTFNGDGNIIGVMQAGGDGETAYANRTEYIYDDEENLTAVVDANAYAITHSDDLYWRNLRRDYGYVDPLTGEGKLVSDLRWSERSALRERYTTHYAYDNHGNLISRTDNADNLTTFTYTAFNKLASETRALGHALATSDEAQYCEKRLALGYAELSANLSAADQAALRALYTVHYTYDAKQNLVEIRSPGGDLTRFEYDVYGNVTRKTVFLDATDLANPATQQVTQYFYDAYGNNIKTIQADAWYAANSDDAYWRDIRKEFGFVDGTGAGLAAADLTAAQKDALVIRYTSFDAYDHFGNRITHTDANGGVTNYSYDKDNNLTAAVDAMGNTTAYRYDAVGNRIAVVDAAGHTTVYVYSRNNQLLASSEAAADPAASRSTQYGYDVVGNRTRIIDAEGRETLYLFREDNRLVEMVSPQLDGGMRYHTRYSYDGVGNRLSVTDANGHVTRYVYNQTHLVKEVTEAGGNVTQYRYDANLNQVQVIIGAQLAPALRRVLRYRFDEEDQRVEAVDAEGNATRTAYDAAGNRIAVTDANGHTTDFEFDAQNRRVREIRPEVTDADGAPVRYTVEHLFDGNGNEIATRDENGAVVRVSFDKNNRAVMISDANGVETVYRYDSRGNRTSVTLGAQAHMEDGQVIIDSVAEAATTTFTYDEFNQVVASVDPIGNALITSDSPLYVELRKSLGVTAQDGSGKPVADLTDHEKAALKAAYTTHYAYDRVGNRIDTVDRLGGHTRTTYDALNRQVALEDAAGERTTRRYDGVGNVLAQTDAVGNALVSSNAESYQALREALGFDRNVADLSAADKSALLARYTTDYAYDADNRLVTTEDPLGVITRRDYDNVGNLVAEVRDAEGAAITTRYIYDLNNRLTDSIDPEQNRTHYEYDAVGNRLLAVDGRGNGQQFVYDALNRTVKVIDPLGFATRYEYDGVGNRLSLTDARGGVTRFTYDPARRLIETTDAEGRITRLEYDARGNRVTETRGAGTADARVTHYDYDAGNQLRAIHDAEGGTTAHAYDAEGHRTATVDANGHTTRYGFDAVGRVLTITDAENRVVQQYAYDAVGNRLSVIDANGHETRYDYDARNAQIRMTDAAGVATSYSYDAVGNRVAVVRADGTTEAQQTLFAYDANGRLVATTDALGNITQNEYDENGNVVRVTNALGHVTQYVYDADNRVTQIIDPLGHITTYGYDAVGNRVQVTDALGSTTTSYYNLDRELTLVIDPQGSATAYSYNVHGQQVAERRYATAVADPVAPGVAPALVPSGADAIRRFGYDDLGRLSVSVDPEGAVTQRQYDAVGNVIRTLAFATPITVDDAAPLAAQLPGASSHDRITTYHYDAVNRLMDQVSADGVPAAYTYDAAGNRLTVTVAGRLSQRVTYDVLNRVATTTDAAGTVTRFDYDALGNRTAQTEAVGTAAERTTTYAYDDANRLVAVQNPAGILSRYTYDALGQQLTTTLASGTADARTTASEYDAAGRIIARVGADGSRETYTYDAVGNRLARTDALGHTWTSGFDRNGRVTSESDPLGHTRRYAYDAFGNRVQSTDPLGNTSTAYYDRDGRLSLQIDAAGAAVAYEYDAFGDLTREIRYALPVGSSDPTARPALTATATDEVRRTAYDAMGRAVRQMDGEGYVVDRAYDFFGNLVAVSSYANPLAWVEGLDLASQALIPSADDRTVSYRYDQLDRLASQTDAEGYVTDFAYDRFGNLMEQVLHLDQADPNNVAQNQITRYTYDVLNRRLSQSVWVTADHAITTAFDYDAVGNRTAVIEAQGTADERIQRTTYDLADRIETSVDAGGTVTRYVYDAAGHLTSRIVGDGRADARTTAYDYDAAGQTIREIRADDTVVTFAYDGAHRLVARTDAYGTSAERLTTFAYDANGRLTDEVIGAGTAEALAKHYAYDAFGNRVQETVGYGSGIARTTTSFYDRNDRLIAVRDGNGITAAYQRDGFGNIVTESVIGADGAASLIRAMHYDGRDQLIREEDGAHHVATRIYDGAGKIRLEIRADGTADAAATQYSYDLANRLTAKVVDPTGLALTTTYGYDERGNLVREELGGRVTTTQYDAMNRATRVTDGEQFITRFGYDAYGNQTTITTGLYEGSDPSKAARVMPATTRYAYDAMNRQIAQADALGIVTRYTYDERGNRTAKIEAYGWLPADEALEEGAIRPLTGQTGLAATAARTTLYGYDAVDRLISEKQPLGTVVAYAYNARGEQIRKVVDAAAGGLNATHQYHYDDGGRLAFQVDPEGAVTHFLYNDRGQVIRKTEGLALGADGQPSLAPTSASRETRTTYDGAGRKLSETVDPSGLALTTRYEYDARGNLIATIDANGGRSEGAYDKADRLVWDRNGEGGITTFTFDARGNKLSETRYASSGADLAYRGIPADNGKDQTVSYVYDLCDRLTQRTDARGIVNKLDYDAVGNVTRNTQNETGLHGSGARVATYSYNLANRVTEQWENLDGSGNVIAGVSLHTTFVYDAVYNTVESTVTNQWVDGEGAHTQAVTTLYSYDLNNRLIGEILDPKSRNAAGLNIQKGYRYDALGNRTAEISANGYAAVAGQDLTAEQREAILAEYTTRTWYDKNSRAIWTVDPLGHVKGAEYDALGNLLRAVTYANPVDPATLVDGVPPNVVIDSSADRTVTNAYDKAGRQIRTELDAVTSYVLNGSGRYVAEISRPTVTKVYDGIGNLLRETDANGYSTYHYYDHRGLEIGTLDAEGILTVNGYDAFGNRITETTYLQSQGLAGDAALHLDLASYSPQGEARIIEHTYDLAGNETATRYPASDVEGQGIVHLTVERTFDAYNLLLSETVQHAEGSSDPAATTYTYDAAGRKIGERDTLGNTTTYAYDAAGGLLEKSEADVATGQVRTTTFELDAAHRTTVVHYPAYDAVTVDADGHITTASGYRARGEMHYDAAGNTVFEHKPDGSEITYRFDQAGRKIAAIDQHGVYTEYGYNAAGDRTFVHRYATTVETTATQPPAVAAADQRIEFHYDTLGRLIREIQLGDRTTAADDRRTQYRYDANGNQVQIVDPRGYAGTLFYDGLGRVIGTVNPAGGLTSTTYDALGNVITRQVGGWNAPAIENNALLQAAVSSSGTVFAWTTDRATDGQIFVRRAGSSEAWQAFGVEGQFQTEHQIALTGLSADTAYEYYVVSSDPFGFNITTGVQSFTTATALENATVSGITQVGPGQWSAQIAFTLPAGTTVSDLTIQVGAAGTEPFTLDNPAEFTPVRQADGSYVASVTLADPETDVFQISYIDSHGNRTVTVAEAFAQHQELGVVDATIHSEAGSQSGARTVTVNWNLPVSAVDTYVDEEDGLLHYSAFITFTPASGEGAQTATVELGADGRFTATFTDIPDEAGSFSFSYARAGGEGMAPTGEIAVDSLHEADTRYQRVALAFSQVTDPAAAEMAFSYRRVGDTEWTPLPATAIRGFGVDLTVLAEGAYEYQATVTTAGSSNVIATGEGRFLLAEAGSLSNVVDANGQTVAHTLDDNRVTFDGLLPLADGEAITVTVTDSQGVETAVAYEADGIDLTPFSPGSYTVHVVKTLTITTTETDAQGQTQTTTTTETVVEITGALTIARLALASAESTSLAGARTLTSALPDSSYSHTVTSTVAGTNTGTDSIYTYFDQNGHKLYSNEEGGVWTRYFYDAQGNAVREVRFRWSNANGAFSDGVVRLANRPSLATLDARYEAAVTADAQGQDTLRVITRTFDTAGHKLSETTHSDAFGAVTDSFEYDRYGNKLTETTAAGTNLEARTEYAFDGMQRLVKVTFPYDIFYDTTNDRVAVTPEQHVSYDAYGNKSTETNERGAVKRYHYGAGGQLLSEWDASMGNGASQLRTDYHYDAFGRRDRVTQTDLKSGVAQVTHYTYTHFDQVETRKDALNQVRSMTYDTAGNLASETDEEGRLRRYEYDAENRVKTRIDALGHRWTTTYDAYGHKISEVDPNGRVTTSTYGPYGQQTGKTVQLDSNPVTAIGDVAAYAVLQAKLDELRQNGPDSSHDNGWFVWLIQCSQIQDQINRLNIRSYSHLRGTTRYTETTGYDWLGHTTQITDSYGKNDRSEYDADGNLVRLTRRANSAGQTAVDQVADYTYDALGRRIEERLTRGDALLRDTHYSYNSRNWLMAVDTEALDQPIHVVYRYDRAGNRVGSGENGTQYSYSYDANNRMRSAYDVKAGQAVESIDYDGFGNRTRESRGNSSTTYIYDLLNRVKTSSAGDTWSYDKVGNTLNHTWSGGYTKSEYDGENHAARIWSKEGNDPEARIQNWYDAAGNTAVTRISSDDYAFEEVAEYDVRYDTTYKYISRQANWVKKAKYLYGDTHYEYDVNGQLTKLDRGRPKDESYNKIGKYAYDNAGMIIERVDKGGVTAVVGQTWGYAEDPTASLPDSGSPLEYLEGRIFAVTGSWLSLVGYNGSKATYHSYLYADGNPVADVERESTLQLKSLALQTGEATPVYEGLDLVGYQATVKQGDLRYDSNGNLDRNATAKALTERLYGLGQLNAAEAQEGLVATVGAKLPEPLEAGATFRVDGHVVVLDRKYDSTKVITDYAYQAIGGKEGLGGGGVSRHTVVAGQDLRAIASGYYGSSSYWYLIADANGLSGDEALTTGTQLTIPNVVTNSLNDKDTYKVYNKSEIIGSDDPVVLVKQKKPSFWQRLIQIIIVVIVVVVSIYLAAVIGPAVFGFVSSAIGGIVGTVAAAAVTAAVGYGVGYATSFATQGLSIMAGLQEEFDWKAMQDMGKSMAASAVAAGLLDWINTAKEMSDAVRVIAKAGVEAGKQLAVDGKINNIAGVVAQVLPTGAGWLKEIGWTDAAEALTSKYASSGLALLETGIEKGKLGVLDWTSFATAALGADKSVNRIGSDGIELDWNALGQSVAIQGGISLAVGAFEGEDAALNYFGNSVGTTLGNALTEQVKFTDDLKQLPPALANEILSAKLSSAEKIRLVSEQAEELRRMDPAMRAKLEAQYRTPVVTGARERVGNGSLTSPEKETGLTLVDSWGTVETSGTDESSEEIEPTPQGGDLRKLLSEDEANDAKERFDALNRHGANLVSLGEQLAKDDLLFKMVVDDLQENGQRSEFAALIFGSHIPSVSEFTENRELFAKGVTERGIFATQLSLRGMRDLGYDVQVSGQFADLVNETPMDVVRAIGTGSVEHLGLIDTLQGDTLKLAKTIQAAGLVGDRGGYEVFSGTTNEVLLGTLKEFVPQIDAVQGAIEAMSAGAAILSLQNMPSPDIHDKAVREVLEKAITAVIKGEAYAAGILVKKLTKIPALRKYVEKMNVGASAEAVTSFVLEASGLFKEVTSVPLQDPRTVTPGIKNSSGWGIDIMAKTLNDEWVGFEVKSSARGKAPALSRGQRQGAHVYITQQLHRAVQGDYRSWKGVTLDVQETADRIQNEMATSEFARFRGYVVKVDKMNRPRNTKTSIYEWKPGVR